MKKNLQRELFQSLGIKHGSDLLGRKIEISFFHKLDAYWYFMKIYFVPQSYVLEIYTTEYATICFPWIHISDKESIRLTISPGRYHIQYKSPVTGDKSVDSEIQYFDTLAKKGNSLSRGKFRIL